MKPRMKTRPRTNPFRRSSSYRPHFDTLEDRVPLGDAILGSALGLAALGSLALGQDQPTLLAGTNNGPDYAPAQTPNLSLEVSYGSSSVVAGPAASPANESSRAGSPQTSRSQTLGVADNDGQPLTDLTSAPDDSLSLPSAPASPPQNGLGSTPGGAAFSFNSSNTAGDSGGSGGPAVRSGNASAAEIQLAANLRGNSTSAGSRRTPNAPPPAATPPAADVGQTITTPKGGNQGLGTTPSGNGNDNSARAELRRLLSYGNKYVPGAPGAEEELDRAVDDILRSQNLNANNSGKGVVSNAPLNNTLVSSDGPSFEVASSTLDPGTPGPFEVTVQEYDFGNSVFDPVSIAGTARVELVGQVIAPTVLEGQRPVLVFLHGNHAAQFNPTTGAVGPFAWPPVSPFIGLPNYRGYEYVGRVLASHGYIVVSVSGNGVNTLGGINMVPRAELMHRTLQMIRDLNATGTVTPLPGETLSGDTSPFDDRFVGHVDLTNIGTMGHSRGGDGVVAHFQLETGQIPGVTVTDPFPIKAVLPLAPVDFTARTINNVPLLTILPYNDGDVFDLQGQGFYDRARYNVTGDQAPKHVVLVQGANHNSYNSIWFAEPGPLFFGPGRFDDGAGAPRLSPPEVRSTGIAYFSAFFRTYVGNAVQPAQQQFFSFITGDSPPPPSVIPAADPALRDAIFWQYHPADSANARRDINRVTADSNLVTNTLGGAVTQSGLTPYQTVLPYTGALGAGTPRSAGLRVARFGWNSPTAFWQNDLPAGTGDASRYFALQFRAAVDFTLPGNPAAGQNFQIVLTDGAGNTAATTVGAAYAGRPNPLYLPPQSRHQAMNTVRIPLSRFSGVDLTDVRSIRFNFNQVSTGGLRVADLMFANRSLGFQVTSTTPGQGDIVAAPPTTFVVDFSDAYDPGTLGASDLTVNGVPATSVTATSPTRATFTYASSPVTAQGLQTLSIAAGALERDSDGEPLGAFDATFRFDVLRLAVVSTDPAVGSAILLPFTQLDVNFNEPIDPASAGTNDLTLSQGTVSGATVLPGNTTVRYTLSSITQEGTLTVTIPAGALTDVFGNPSLAFTGTYALDIGTVPFPELTPESPLGSLIYSATVPGVIAPASDTDEFTVDVGAGQTIAVVVRPTTPGLRPAAELRDPSGTPIGNGTAAAANQEAYIQALPTGKGGLFTISVSGAAGTAGSYTVQVILNAALEDEVRGGPSNNTRETAQGLGNSIISLSGTTSRAAVIGRTDTGASYSAAAVTPTFENIATTGTPILQGVDDAAVQLTAAQLGGFTFPFFGTTFNTLFVSSNGLISFGSAFTGFTNTDLTTVPDQAAIAAFWDDLVTFNPASSVFWQVLGSGASQRLVVQWNNVQFFAGGTPTLTFQAVLNTDGSIQFNYGNLSGALPGSDEGGSATVGIKAAGPQGPNRLLLAFDNGPNTFVGNNRSTRINPPGVPTTDFYSLTLEAGDTLTAGLTGAGATLTLQDEAGVSLAVGRAGAANLSRVINNFVAPASGTYFLNVGGDPGVNYTLVATRNADFNTEPNEQYQTRPAQPLGPPVGGVQAALGYIGGSTTAGVSQARVLYFVDTVLRGPDAVRAAMTNLGINPVVASSFANFNTQLAAGGWDLVVLINQNFDEHSYETPLANWVSGGGKAIYGSWSRAPFPAALAPQVAAAAFGAQYTRQTNFTQITQTVSHPVWTGISNPYALDNPGWLEFSSGLEVTTGQAIGIYNPTQAAIVVGNNGRTILNGFASDTPTNPVERVRLYENELSFVLASSDDADLYQIRAEQGQTIQIDVSTPLDGPGQPGNTLDAKLRVLGPDGEVVAEDDNSGANGRNPSLSFIAPASGLYFIEVSISGATAAPTEGEYHLTVEGGSSGKPLFQVISTDPIDRARLRTAPTTLTVAFNNNVLLTSVDASDLTVAGLPATGFTVLGDGRVRFNLPALPQGEHPVVIESGAIVDVQGNPLFGYTGEITFDATGPRVIAATINEGDVLPVGSISYTVVFDEPLDPSRLATAANFTLRGNDRAINYPPASFGYILDGSFLVINYNNLPEDRYTLTLLSGVSGGATGLQDLAGNALDGAPSFPLPSGDGVPGGNYVLNFVLDAETSPFPALAALPPPGSLIYQGQTLANIHTASDTDSYTLNVDAGQTITVLVTPGASGLQPAVEVRGPSGNVLGSAVAPAAGQPALLQTLGAGSDGTYTITVSGTGTGLYTARVTLNAAQELESIGGPSNDDRATAQDLDSAFTALPNGASRAALRGRSDLVTYTAAAVTPAFENIAATGTPILQGVDDAAVQLTAAQLGGFTFPFYGTTFNTLFVASNGIITFGSAFTGFLNADLTTTPTQAAIAPFWDDLVTFEPASSVFWQVLGTGASQRLVVQWNNVGFFTVDAGGTAISSAPNLTFQAVLSANGSIQFNYGNLTSDLAGSEEGMSATVGIKAAGAQGPNRLLLAFNNGPNTFVGSNRSTRITPPGAATTVFLADFESGAQGFTINNSFPDRGTGLWHLSTGRGTQLGHSATQSFYYGRNEGPAGGGTYDTGESNAGAITSPPISLPSVGRLTVDFNYVLQTEVFTGFDLAQLQVSNNGGASFTTLANYNVVAESNVWRAATPVDISSFSGQTVQLRWFFDTVDGDFNNFEGWYVDDVRVQQQLLPSDYYSFTLEAGQTVSVVSAGGTALGLALESADGKVLATGRVVGTNVSRAINNFVAPTAGTYFARIDGASQATDYSLVITRGADFDTEDNSSSATAQDITGTGGVLGSVASTGNTAGARVLYFVDTILRGPDAFLAAFNNLGINPVVASSFANFNTQLAAGGWNFVVLINQNFDEHSYETPLANWVNGGGRAIFGSWSRAPFPAAEAPQVAAAAFGAQYTRQTNFTQITQTVSSPIWTGISNPLVLSNPGWLEFSSGLQVTTGQAIGTFNATQAAVVVANDGRTILNGFASDTPDNAVERVRLYQNEILSLLGPDDDWYAVQATEGQQLVFETTTPGDGPGEFGNTLNPRIELYGPGGGEPIAVGTVLGDGRNERIVFTVPAGSAGTYRVRVTTEGETRGEYFLSLADTRTAGSDGARLDPAAPLAFSLETVAAPANLDELAFAVAGLADHSTPPVGSETNNPAPVHSIDFVWHAGLVEDAGGIEAGVDDRAVDALFTEPVDALDQDDDLIDLLS